MTAPVILFVGDVSWDTTVITPRVPEPDEKVLVEHCFDGVGGVGANSAVACALTGTAVKLMAPVGPGALGGMISTALETLGVPAELERTDGPTGRALVVLEGLGEKRLFLYPGHSMYPSSATTANLQLDGVRWVHTVIYDRVSAGNVIEACRAAGIPWSIDLEPATIPDHLDDLRPHLAGCHTAIINARAKQQLGPDAVRTLHTMGVREVIETLGRDGARLHRKAQPVVDVLAPSLPGRVRDTTGAGDAFAGWYTAERVRGNSAESAVHRAVQAASHSVRQYGMAPSYPTRSSSGEIVPRSEHGKAHP
ncbi:MAG: carbohydrate kinase family protein [Propionibacteriaceae bacterium]